MLAREITLRSGAKILIFVSCCIAVTDAAWQTCFSHRNSSPRSLIPSESLLHSWSKVSLSPRRRQLYSNTCSRLTATTGGSAESLSSEIKPCFYKHDGRWRQRMELDTLVVGQKLLGEKIDGADLLNGKTGPKIFFECGVGRVDSRGNWHMVSGMLRLGKKWTKESVSKKRSSRLTGKVVELFVSKIRSENGKLEVVTSVVDNNDNETVNKFSASNLRPGQEVVGQVIRVMPYGVMVDVGANRNGLLHIQKVADLYGTYIDKEEGLAKAGLERGAKIRLSVLSNEKKRLFLDFTEDVKAADDFEQKLASPVAKREEISDKDSEYKEGSSDGISEDEAAGWAAYATTTNEEDYDEDRDIEDALGIGMY